MVHVWWQGVLSIQFCCELKTALKSIKMGGKITLTSTSHTTQNLGCTVVGEAGVRGIVK